MSEDNKQNLEETDEGQLTIDGSDKIVYSGDEDRNIKSEMEDCYIDYAMSVIVSRALPDIRDGLKPVHRRILYSMYEQGLKSTAKFRKSAKVVGDVLAKFHPHGDSSVYDAMVRMAQDFSLRYPLVQGQGNFGSMDGDGAAAYRYTEARMAKIAEYLLSDIEKETVDFKPNFDNTELEPTVFPTRLPNLLLNGVMGIAVGMATNIPPHNLRELVDAIEYLLHSENPEEITISDLMNYVKGPDFPTGGIIYDNEAILNAYSTGRGSIVVRGVANIEETKKGRSIIHISEIPYGLNKAVFVEKIADLVRDKKIVGISELRDESSGDHVRVIIELKKDAFPKKILNQLYKLTSLQTTFSLNMVGLNERGMQPKLNNLKDLLISFIDHRKEVVERRTIYELKVAEARAHILEGLKIALDNIDEVIRVIRNSYDDAEEQLMMAFELSRIQAEAIVEMRLKRLQGLEKEKLENELNEKLILIEDLKDILAKPERIISIISTELQEVREIFGDDRRTKVNPGKIGEFNPKDTIPNEDIFIVYSKNSYIKRIKSDSFRTQKRGGKGVTTGAKEDDEIKLIIPTRNHNDLLYFTTKGRVFTLPAYEVPETARTAKGQPVINLIGLQKDEEVAAIMDITGEKGKYLFFVTNLGTVKKLEISELRNIRSNGLKVLGVKENDELTWVKSTSGEDNIFIATKNGKAIRFDENDVRPMGRTAFGVRGIKLKEGDNVIEVAVMTENDKYILTITENGYGKLSEVEEYKDQNRGGSGSKAMAITAKTGKMVGAMVLSDESRKNSDIILISKLGQTIRINLKGIRNTAKVTQGVILTKLKEDTDMIVGASIVKEGDIENEES
ncbi:DNA gyrase subunit A [Candidatus Gracilibacteria bacterium]|nr:MAG: DNA gyrase subunit A [Candidatus Gracilibacteria bacterium]